MQRACETNKGIVMDKASELRAQQEAIRMERAAASAKQLASDRQIVQDAVRYAACMQPPPKRPRTSGSRELPVQAMPTLSHSDSNQNSSAQTEQTYACKLPPLPKMPPSDTEGADGATSKAAAGAAGSAAPPTPPA